MSIYEIDAKVKELRELRNMEAEVKSAITAIEDSLKAEMLAKNTDVLSGTCQSALPPTSTSANIPNAVQDVKR